MRTTNATLETPARPHIATSTVNIGVIGCGGRIRNVLRRVLNAAQDGVRVIALVDPDEDSLEQSRQELNPQAKSFVDVQSMLREPSIDWIAIGSWNRFHAEQILAALHAGKHVFCEKPLATSLEDCIAVRDTVRETGKMFSFGLVLRYSPHYQRIEQLVRSGRIGRVVSMEFNETLHFNHGGYIMGCWRRLRENAGTHLLEKCCHDIDLVNWILKSVPVRAASFGGNDIFRPENRTLADRVGPGPEGQPPYTWPATRDSDPFSLPKTILDNQVAILEYANGVRATFHTNMTSGLPERRMYIVGTEGAIRADALSGAIELRQVGWETTLEQHGGLSSDAHAGGDDVLAQSVARTMCDGVPPLVGVEEAMRSAIACFGIDQAQDEGRVVNLRPLWQRAGIAV